MKFRALIIFTLLVLLMTVCSAAFPVNGEVELYDKLIRLHVLANSDSEEDQALKLKVRDAVLEYANDVVSGCTDISEAKQIIEQNTDGIRKKCADVVSGSGYDYPVSIQLGYEKYPEKSYGSVTLPSGDYYSVRVMIGEAEGHNWWCVLFPPLCVGAAKDERAVMTQTGLTKNEVDILTENDGDRYVLKFRIIEFFRRAFTQG